MFPHERSLVAKMKNRPFALLGVNTDRNLAQVKTNLKSQNLNWRSWYDGSTGGPICKQYKVEAFPTLYVIDHKGIIRHKFRGAPSGEELDKLVEEMVNEVKK